MHIVRWVSVCIYIFDCPSLSILRRSSVEAKTHPYDRDHELTNTNCSSAPPLERLSQAYCYAICSLTAMYICSDLIRFD